MLISESEFQFRMAIKKARDIKSLLQKIMLDECLSIHSPSIVDMLIKHSDLDEVTRKRLEKSKCNPPYLGNPN